MYLTFDFFKTSKYFKLFINEISFAVAFVRSDILLIFMFFLIFFFLMLSKYLINIGFFFLKRMDFCFSLIRFFCFFVKNF